jgi:hypothetical protein
VNRCTYTYIYTLCWGVEYVTVIYHVALGLFQHLIRNIENSVLALIRDTVIATSNTINSY